MKESIEKFGRYAQRPNLITKMLAGDPEKGTEPLSDEDISSEVSNLIFAATDTTALEMAYLLYELACHPEWQEALRREIQASGVKEANFCYLKLQHLPILNALIQETFRVHPGVPPGLPRTTPKQGHMIDGIFVPGDVRTSYL